MTKRQIVARLVAEGQDLYAIGRARMAVDAADPVPRGDWDAFYAHLVALYHAPLHQRRYLLRQTCRAFDIPIDPSLEDRPAPEQLVMF